MKTAIGIDIGGTKISMVIGTVTGKILARREIPTFIGKKAKKSISQIISTLKELIAEAGIKKKDILGVGVAVPGPVNSKKGVIPKSPNLPGWKGLPLKKELSQKLGLPVRIANDANAAALGEKVFGEAKAIKDFIYITVSTGVGGGIVINGKLLEGAGWSAGEVGHMVVVAGGEECGCVRQGCLEAYASGTAIAKYVRERMIKRRSLVARLAGKHEKFSARIVGMAAKEGDQLAIESYKRAGYYLGIGIGNLLNLFNPEKIILSGGVFGSAPPLFWNTMIKSCKNHAWPAAFKTAKIVRSKLKGRVGDFGALALIFSARPSTSSGLLVTGSA